MGNDILMEVILGILTVVTSILIIYIDKKTQIDKKQLIEIKNEIEELENLTVEEYFYKYFGISAKNIFDLKEDIKYSNLKKPTGILGDYEYKIIFNDRKGDAVLKSYGFDIKYYTLEDIRKIMEKRLEF